VSIEPAAAQSAMMQVTGLRKRYGEQSVLAGITFSIEAGEVLGVIGPNGAGKTTLMKVLAGLVPADAGTVFWRGVSLAADQRKQCMFYVPDGLRPWPDQHVARVLQFLGGVYRRPESYVAEAVRSVGLMPVLGKRVIALSKGYARRLGWAAAVIAPHPLLLMDEPFDGFDLRQTREMAQRLRLLVRAGRTLIVSIHQLADAERVCDRFVLLSDGHVRGIGTLEMLRAQTRLNTGSLEDIFLALT
jgi:ABC-type multidrug transport system ATPase subunit